MGMFNLSQPVQDTTVKAVDTLKEEESKNVIEGGVSQTDAVIAGTTQEVTEDPKQKTIVLDGPLSQIYTQALNIAYAKEGVGMMMKMFDSIDHKEDDDALDDSYVYVIDADDLTQQALIESSECLRVATSSGKYKNVVLAIESHSGVNSKMQLLSDMGLALGAKVHYSRNSAIQGVLSSLKKD